MLEISFYFALLSLIIVTPYILISGEINLIIEPTHSGFWFYAYLMLSGVMGIAITIFVMLAYTVCQPLTVNISMVFKDVL